jgi:hypothetical protein
MAAMFPNMTADTFQRYWRARFFPNSDERVISLQRMYVFYFELKFVLPEQVDVLKRFWT